MRIIVFDNLVQCDQNIIGKLVPVKALLLNDREAEALKKISKRARRAGKIFLRHFGVKAKKRG